MTTRAALSSLAMVATLSGVATAQVKLELKPEEGKTVRTRTVGKIHQILTINGMDIETNVDVNDLSRAVYAKRAADGTLPIAITSETFALKLELPGNVELNFDSANPDAKIELPQYAFLAEAFKVMSGATYTVVLDAKNKVKAVEGAEAIMAKAKDLSPQAVAAIKERFDSERIKRDFEQIYDVLPEGFVREGEPWNRTVIASLGAGQTLTLKNRLEYKGTTKKGDRTLDKIESKAVEVTLVMEPNAESPAKIIKSDLKIDSSEGTLLFDRETGSIVDRSSKTRIKGDLTLKIGEAELSGKLDLTLGSTSKDDPAPDSPK